MKAVRIDGQTPGKNRAKLSEALPIDTPYLVQIFPVYGCNFKCNYCIHSVDKLERSFISNEVVLDFDVFKKAIDELADFKGKLKMLRFAGTGEPLMHKDIAKMVKYAREKDVSETIDIVTNGSLLTRELADELIDAGLSRLRISIQGIDSIGYKETSGVNIHFDNFVENIKYFYNNKKDTKIYIKIIDSALGEGHKEKFFNIFGDICDEIAIEHLLPAVPQIDYSSISKDKLDLGQNGTSVQEVEVCPQPFYMMQINPDGNVVPCCSMETACILGNCKRESLQEIWAGERFNTFRRRQLSKEKSLYPVCRRCNQYKYAMFKEDILDDDADRLLKLF